MCVCSGFTVASGETYTWTGAAGDGKWETAENWENNANPVSAEATVIVLSTREGAPDIVKAAGEFTCKRIIIAAGSAALKLSGGTFNLRQYGGWSASTTTEGSTVLYCQATGVPVEIASTLKMTGERHLLQAAGSDLTLSGRLVDVDGSRKGTLVKYVDGGSNNARFTLAGTCEMWGQNGSGLVMVLRGGTNVIASADAIATGSQTTEGGRSVVRLGTWNNSGSSGTTLVLNGGTYETSFRLNVGSATAMDMTTVFKGDTVVTGDFTDTTGKGGTKTFRFDGASSVRFNGDVATGTRESPHGQIGFAGTGVVSFRVDGAFVCSTTVKNTSSAFHCDFRVGAGSRFGGNHNSATDYYFQYDTIHAMAENVFDPRTVIRWGYYANNTWGVFDLNGYDQTVNRFEHQSSDPNSGRLVKTEIPARLTLKATAGSYCQNRLSGPLTLVYDAQDASYVQTLTNNAYVATGDIVVSNGTLRLAGTATYKNASAIRVSGGGTFENASTIQGALENVPLFVLDAGGTFRQAAGAADPFGQAKARFELEQGAVIDLQDADGLTLPEVWVDGVLQNEGRYQAIDGTDSTAVRVDWLTGVGVMEVSGVTFWKTATDGEWSTAANWSHGVPQAGQTVRLMAEGASYTVTVSGPETEIPDLEVSNVLPETATVNVAGAATFENAVISLNPGARVTVPEGGRVLHTQALFDVTDLPGTEKDIDRVSLRAGAAWSVTGGSTVLTNYLGILRIAGTDDAPGRLNVTGGTFDFFPAKTSWSRIWLDEGGEINLSGGTTRLIPAMEAFSYVPLVQNGGTLDVSGEAVLEFGKVGGHVLGTGLSRFGGSAKWTISPEVARDVKIYTGPYVNNTTSRLEFVESAKFWTEKWATVSLFQLGYDNTDSRAPMWTPIRQGTAVLDYASDAHSRLGAKLSIGSDYCRGEAYLRSGTVSVHYNGVDVGGFTEGLTLQRTDARGDGLLVIDGADLLVEARNRGIAERRNWLDGVIVGAGYHTNPDSGNFYRGRLELKSGSLESNENGAFVILGAGQASGVFVQTGGTFTHEEAGYPMAIGFEGGEGLYALSNGTAAVASDLYVGGVLTNTLGRCLATFCRHRHDATGRLVLAGGSLTVEKDVIVSADGFGTVEVGPAGSLTMRDFVLSNGTETVSTAALAFTVGTDGATGTVTASGKLTVCPGAALTVDFSAYTGEKSSFGLVSCNGLEGAFAEENITVTGLDEKMAALVRVIQDDAGVRVGIMHGTVLTFR